MTSTSTESRSRRLAARTPSRCRGDEGFSLMELVIALLVVFVAVTVLAGVFVGSLQSLTAAKQRQSATALATRAMEQLRALPFSALTSGLSTADLAGDPNIVGTPARLRPAVAPTVDELLQTNTPAASTATCTASPEPLLPHRCPKVLDGITYTVASYVSQVPGASPVQYSLTTIVEWSSRATRGASKSVVLRSRAFSPNGTCSPANHPFNTPCQSQYHATAGLSEGGVTVSGTADGVPIAPGLDVLSAELSLPRLSTSTAVEQTVSVTGATAPHTARLVRTGGVETSGEQALSSAATDPSNTDPAVPTAVAAAAGALSRTDSGWTVQVSPEGAGSWSTTSRAAAGTASGCHDADGLAVDGTGQPCGASSNHPSSAAGLTVSPPALSGRPLGSIDVASFGPAATPARAFGARFTAARAGSCPTASGPGCVAAGASRALGTTVFGGLPAGSAGDTVPAGFLGAVVLDGYSSRVSAASGNGTPAGGPLASRAGSLRTFNGTAYTTTDLATTTTAVTLPVSVTASYTASAATTVVVNVTGTVKVTPPTVSAAGCAATSCEAGTGTVTADLVYDLLTGTTTHARFLVRADIGALLAKSAHKAA